MAQVIVERSFEEPVELDDIQAIEDRGASCLELHRVRFLKTYFSSDRRRMICRYEAPDAESVRIAQREVAMPVERVWTATVHELKVRKESSMELVVVERSLDEPLAYDPMDLAAKGAPCMEMHNLRYLRAYLSSDKKRMICVFEAPDAESVHIVSRQLKVPVDRVWTATVHEPE